MGESYRFMRGAKDGMLKAYILHSVLYVISAILGKPGLVAKLLAEIAVWRGLSIVDILIREELLACELAGKVGWISMVASTTISRRG